MFSADVLACTSRMLFVAVTPFSPVPGTLLDASSTSQRIPIIDHRRVSAYDAVRASQEDDFELLAMPRTSEASTRSATRMTRRSTSRQQKRSSQLSGSAPSAPEPCFESGSRPSGFVSAVSLAKQSAISRSKTVFGALRRRPYLRV